MGDQAVAEGKKSARRRGALIVFQDESGFSLLASVRSTWRYDLKLWITHSSKGATYLPR